MPRAPGATPAPPAREQPPRRAADRPAPPADRITLTLQTRPPGASVVGPSGSLGTTPLPWTVRPGTTHTLTFAKSGFHPATRRISADKPARDGRAAAEDAAKPEKTRQYVENVSRFRPV